MENRLVPLKIWVKRFPFYASGKISCQSIRKTRVCGIDESRLASTGI